MASVVEYKCDICNITVNSERILEDHNRGKKHQKNLELQQNNSYCKTVRVYDFPPGQYAKEMLWQYFERYGPIEEIDMDYWNPGIGYVTYKRPGSAVTCLTQKRHYIDDYEIWVEPVNLNFEQPKPKPKKAKEAQPKDDTEITEKLLGEATVAAQMTWLTKELEMKVMDSTVHKNLVDSLQEIFNYYFPGCVVYRFGSSLNGLGTRGCDLDVFLDLNLDKPLTAQQARKLPRPYPNVSDIASFANMRGRFMSRDELSKVPVLDQVKLCGKILLQEGNSMGVTEIQTIPSNRCPVVRFKHGPSNVQMDMTLNNRTSLRNTQLLLLFQQIEPRFRQIMFTIRQWAKSVDICGSTKAGQKMTTYALTMLAVFYLQNTKPAVLPTVEQLAQIASRSCLLLYLANEVAIFRRNSKADFKLLGGDDRMVVYNWDCSFTSNKSEIPATQNQESAVELLAGFFEFFTGFDFVNRMVCPRAGKAIPLADLGVEFKSTVLQNFRIAPICIQDPFVLDHNLTQNMNELARNKFVAAVKVAASKVRTACFNEAQEMQAWGLPYLFSAEEVTLTDAPVLPAKLTKHLIPVPMTFGSCPKLFTIAVMLGIDLNEGWCQYVSNAFQFILEDVLMTKVEVLMDRTDVQLKIGAIEVDPESGAAKPGQKRPASSTGAGVKKSRVEKMEVEEENLDDVCKARLEEAKQDQSVLLLLRCQINDKIWVNRKNYAGKAALKTADINFERAITKQLINSGDAKMYCPLEFLVEVRHKLDPCQVICGLELMGDDSAKGDFNTFSAFMEVFHVKIMNQL